MTDDEYDEAPAITRIARREVERHESRMHPPSPIPAWLYPPRTPLGDGDQCLTISAEELAAVSATIADVEGFPLMSRIVHRDGSPWVEFDVVTGPERPPRSLEEATRLAILSRPGGYRTERFALWRYTLDVYRVGPDGAVEDDPIKVGYSE